MTSVVIETTRSVIGAHLSDALSIIAIALLLVLLIQKELLRAFGSRQFAIWERTLNIAIVPLLLAFGIIVIRHILSLLHVW